MKNSNASKDQSKKPNWWKLVFDVIKVVLGFLAGMGI